VQLFCYDAIFTVNNTLLFHTKDTIDEDNKENHIVGSISIKVQNSTQIKTSGNKRIITEFAFFTKWDSEMIAWLIFVIHAILWVFVRKNRTLISNKLSYWHNKFRIVRALKRCFSIVSKK